MTMSKERFEQIALEVWPDISIRGNQDSNQNLKDYAHALIKRVEAECKKDRDVCGFPVIYLPLVEE